MAAPLSIDVFWSFRSPWSYLATPRLLDWSRRYDLDVVFRPVYPLAIRTPEFFDRQNPLWFSYFMTEHRVAQFLDLPFKWPNPDPVVQEGHGMEFADSVSRLIWGGTENWYDGDHLARATARAGLDLATLDAIATTDVERIEAVIARNQTDHEAAGHWGVPTVAFRGEPFFGQDRLDVLLWRLQQNGLRDKA
jgi:2-hydroxychromene-2-carboxylate isomerase